MNDIDVDLNQRILITASKVGPAEDTITISVDANDASKILKIWLCLKRDLIKKITQCMKNNLNDLA